MVSKTDERRQKRKRRKKTKRNEKEGGEVKKRKTNRGARGRPSRAQPVRVRWGANANANLTTGPQLEIPGLHGPVSSLDPSKPRRTRARMWQAVSRGRRQPERGRHRRHSEPGEGNAFPGARVR